MSAPHPSSGHGNSSWPQTVAYSTATWGGGMGVAPQLIEGGRAQTLNCSICSYPKWTSLCANSGYAWERTSENSVMKLSEKSRRYPKRGPTRRPNHPIRPVLAPIHGPNIRLERHANPFSDSFLTEFSEVRQGKTHQTRGRKVVGEKLVRPFSPLSPLRAPHPSQRWHGRSSLA